MPNSKGRRRRFGSIRKLPSGRYQARYSGPDGVDRPADDTFDTRADPEDWLTRKEAEILEGEWIDPDAGNVFVPAYVEAWIGENTSLRPKTMQIYQGLLRSHIAPHLATVTVGEMTLPRVRRWRKKLIDSGVSAITVAKVYRLLRAVFNTALEDEMIKRNPCRIKGAGSEDSPERPVLTVAEVYALADAVGLRYRSLILLAAFTSLRWAELAALTPADIDLDARTVRVARQLITDEPAQAADLDKLIPRLVPPLRECKTTEDVQDFLSSELTDDKGFRAILTYQLLRNQLQPGTVSARADHRLHPDWVERARPHDGIPVVRPVLAHRAHLRRQTRSPP